MDASASPSIGGDGVLTLAMTGELDLGSRDSFREVITTAIQAGGVTRVVVDLGSVTFLDSSAIGVLVGGWRLAQRAGKGFGLIHARGAVRRVLDITALWGHLGITEESLDSPAPAQPDPGPA